MTANMRRTRSKNAEENYLMALVQGAIGREWAEKQQGWERGVDDTVCDWNGIKCDEDSGLVITIDLTEAHLDGTLPDEIGKLSSLKQIIISENDFRGTIPESIFRLPSLEVLKLSGNRLEGQFPYFSSGELTMLDLSHNHFTGTLPSDIGLLFTSLKLFDASHNGFTGTIPRSFGYIETLDYFDMSNNKLEGTLPPSLGDLKSLQGLFLDHNSLIGTIPPSITRSDSKLVQLFLEANNLSGTVPVALADLKNLKDLYIDENKFTGILPQEICNQNFNEDFFEGTDLDSPDRDACESIACPANTMSKEGVYPCVPCGAQFTNPFLGRVGRCYHTNERILLKKIFDSLGGSEWKSAAGWDTDSVSQCDFEGITCNGSGHVMEIVLPDHGITGTLPVEIGLLRHLRVLNLADNEIHGHLPSSLKFPPLERLDISGNKLVGFVPPMLCLTGDINGNGAYGNYRCDFIACNPGFHSSTGFATYSDDGQVQECKPCVGTKIPHFLGSKTCNGLPLDANKPKMVASNQHSPFMTAPTPSSLALPLVVAFAVLIGSYIKKQDIRLRMPSFNVKMPSFSSLSRPDASEYSLPSVNSNIFPRIHVENIPRPNLNRFKVIQAKFFDFFGVGQHEYEDVDVDAPSVDTSQAVTSDFSKKESVADACFVGNVIGDDMSVGSNMSTFTYGGDGVDEDDTSLVCRSGLKKKSDENTVTNRRKIDDRPPMQKTDSQFDEVSSFGSGFDMSSEEEEIDDDDDDEDEYDEGEGEGESGSHGSLSMLALSQNIPTTVQIEERRNSLRDSNDESKEDLVLEFPDMS